jgi:hypothetical protein
VSIARLHGEACWHCGAVTRSLAAAGEIVLADGPDREWPVVTCGGHPLPGQRTGEAL